MKLSDIRSIVDRDFDTIVAQRRYLHQHPELSFQEAETTAYLEKTLRAIGIEDIRRVTKTGVVAVIPGGHPGKRIALRADIDALPIQEENGLPFCSQNPGAMHACGHDGHTAMLLEAARVLWENRQALHGEVVCLFQHAEETPPGGAAELVKAGAMDGVEEVFGLHLSSNYPTGKFGVRAGALTSATDRFDIRIIGKGGHSAMPEQGVDPIVTGAQVILALQTVLSRRISALEPAVLSVCQAQAGDAYNVIPGEMLLVGSVRTFSPALRQAVPEMIRQIVAGITAAAGAQYEFQYELGYASVVNDPALTAETERLLSALYGETCILPIDPVLPGEDFSALHEHCPGCFLEVGTADAEKGTCFPHHNAKYVMDEEGLRYGAGYLLATVFSRLGALEA